MSFHKDLIGDDLHPTKVFSYNGNPTGVRTPLFVGELLVDENTNVFYRASGSNNTDWDIIGGSGNITELAELEDVIVLGRDNGDTLKWNQSLEAYEHGPGGITSLSELEDVDDTGIDEGDILRWNQSTSKYEPIDNVRKLEELEDVDATNRVDKSLVVWNEDDSKYEHQTELQAPTTNSVYVNPLIGSDSTGDGTIFKPYQTIKFAINSITNNDSTNRYEIVLSPGVYEEDNPIFLKDYVSIAGRSSKVIRIEALNTGQDLFDLPGNAINTELDNVTFYNAATVINIDNASSMTFRNCILEDCGNGYIMNGGASSSVVILENQILNPNRSCNRFLQVLSGRMTLRSTTFATDVDVNTVVEAEGSDSFAVINGLSCLSSNTTNGIYIKDNAQCIFDGVLLRNITNGLRCDSGGKIIGYSFEIKADTWDILQEDNGGTSGEFILDAGQISNFRKTKLVEAENFKANLTYYEPNGEIASFTSRSFAVGLSEKGRTASFGEGDSASRGLRVYRYDGSTFTDVSTIAESPDASTFTFPTTVDSGFYISTTIQCELVDDCKQFLGFKVNFTAPMVLGSGNYIMEYWNGSSWSELSYMVTDGNRPYLPNNRSLHNLSGFYNVRFNCLMPKDWTKNDPVSEGTDKFWVRFRITSEIDFSPEIEEIVVHSNHSMFNRDGWLEYFGTARPIGTLPWHWGLVEAAISSPANSDIYIASDFAVGMQENQFNSSGSPGIGFLSSLPFDLDTSCPIRLRLTWFVDDDNSGDVYWRVRVSYTTDDDLIYTTAGAAPDNHPNVQEVEEIISVGPNEANQQRTTTFQLPVDQMISRRLNDYGDQLWVYVERNSSDEADTYGGSVIAFGITPVYTRWCEGAHEESSPS